MKLLLFQSSKMELRKRKQPEDTHGNSNTDNGVGDENHNSIQTDEYTNCTHGDLADYTCVECLYNRWRSQANFKKPPAPVKSDSVIVIDDDVPDQLHRVPVEKVTEKVNPSKPCEKASDNIPDHEESPSPKDTSDDIKSESENNIKESEEPDEPKVVEDKESVNPLEIISAVNWLEVFKYVGISIPVMNVQ